MPEAWPLQFALAGYAAALGFMLLGIRADGALLRGAVDPAATTPQARRVFAYLHWWPATAAALGAALALHTLALGLRWHSLGHGPFTTLHEILSSNLWSLSLIVAVAAFALREVRAALLPAFVPLAVLAGWLAASNPGPGHLPPTYDTPLLYLHTLVGKLYLGLLLVAAALGARSWYRASTVADSLAYRFAAAAFVFETLMLTVGAVWAQDAWGRYWAWDPLESWSFASWIALAFALHARVTLRPRPAWFAALLAGAFVLGFLTFFGVPFLSTAPHKGAV
jgi:ABC-type transport system involved in cytochrome c biogenesis permease subunit